MEIETLLFKTNSKYIWDEEAVFCFTSDIDWASEAVMNAYFNVINPLNIEPTLFVTHHSDLIEKNYKAGRLERGIHPNFMAGSSHGNSFTEVAETCIKFAPESYGFRSHRAFDVTDITHLLKNKYNYKYVSNQITVLQQYIRPFLHESGLVSLPVFFEDGTHLYNQLDLNFRKYENLFITPGLKIISFHPMNFIFNSPTLLYMRQIKDSLTREEYNNISASTIERLRNNNMGIGNTVIDIINSVKMKNLPVLSMNDIYNTILNS